MANLQQRLDDLRHELQNLPDDGTANSIAQLERAARSLLADAKNTPYEPAAQALFAELARTSSPTSPTAATVRGLVRRDAPQYFAGSVPFVDNAVGIVAEARYG